MSQLTLENKTFASFVWYGSLVLLKTVAMSLLTVYYRVTLKSVPTPEDTVLMESNKEKQKAMLLPNKHIERVRRCHLNDLENVLPYVAIALLYITTIPDLETATLHFQIFLGARILHTVAYVFALPQPLRLLGFGAGVTINLSMLLRIFYAVSNVTDADELSDCALNTLLKDPGFSIQSMEYLLNMQDDEETDDTLVVPRGITVPYTRSKEKKFVTLQEYEEVMDCEIDLLRDAIRFVRREIKQTTDSLEEPMDEDNLCTICYANPIQVEFKPCQHTSCRTCIKQQLMSIKECFYCKATVDSIEDLNREAAQPSQGPSTSSQ